MVQHILFGAVPLFTGGWSQFARAFEFVLVGTAVVQSGLLCYHAVARNRVAAWVAYGIAVIPTVVQIRMFGSGWPGFMWSCLIPGMERLQADPWLRVPGVLIPIPLVLLLVAPIARMARAKSRATDRTRADRGL
jgi:hypothetical protein